MTDLLRDIETYLVAKGVVGSARVCIDTMLEYDGTTIALYEYSGKTPLPQITGAVRSVQVVVRDRSAATSRDTARAIYAVLTPGDDGIKYLTPERWCMLFIKQPPFKIKVDDAGRSFYGFNVDITTYVD